MSLAPDTSSGDIELFHVTVSQPFTDVFTTYPGTYTLFGGTTGPEDQDNLAEASFSVTANAPEPGSIALLGMGLGFVVWRYRRKLVS